MMTILVTGANGFLGSKLVEMLNQYPHIVVITTDKKGACDFKGDLSDITFVNSLPNVDCLVNCAAVQYVSSDLPIVMRKRYFEKNNVISASNLASRYSGKVKHLIHVGTSMMYALGANGKIAENSNFNNNGVYSESKIEAWTVLKKMNNKTSMVVPCIIAGPGRGGLFLSLINTMSKYRIAIFPGSGKTLVQMVHVDDVARLLVKVIEQGSEGIFNAGGKNALTIDQWITEISLLIHKKSTLFKISIPLLPLIVFARMSAWRIIAREQVEMLKTNHSLDISNSQNLGWTPKFDNAEIIRSTAQKILNDQSKLAQN